MGSSVGNSVGKIATRVLIVLATTLLVACSRVEAPKNTGELVIGILPGPITYQEKASVSSGFEHDLIERFAASLKLKTRYIVLYDQSALFTFLKKRKIQLAAGAPIHDDPKLIFSTPIQESKQVLVGNNDNWLAHDEDFKLEGRSVKALFGSPQAKALQKLSGDPPRFTLIEERGVSDHDLLQDVAKAKTPLVASDMLNYSLALNFFPDLVVVQELPDVMRNGWAFLPENLALAAKADAFLAAAHKDGTLARLHDRYFGHIQRIKSDGITHYIHDIRTLLPRYRKQFEAAQAATGIDWRMIAALAYQESKWDPQATSFTNVRGIMMLTEDTADRMGVNDRLDPAQSIRAGARYFATMKDELPEEVQEPDRTWMALAAYNLGMGHLNGGRIFAKQMKRDANSWYDMKKVLPLMSQPEFYNRLKAGPARGGEAVVLVENVRSYYDILSRFEPAWQLTPELIEPEARTKKTDQALASEVRRGNALIRSTGVNFLRLPEKAAQAFAESTRVDVAASAPGTTQAAPQTARKARSKKQTRLPPRADTPANSNDQQNQRKSEMTPASPNAPM